MTFWPFRRRALDETAFMVAQTEELVKIYNRIAERRPAKKYLYGAAMLRGAIGSFDDARREA